MTVTYSDTLTTELEQLREAVGSTGMIDTMPDQFYQDLIDYGIETAEQFEDAYQGSYRDGAEFSESMIAESGYLDQADLPDFITHAIDYDVMWECSLSYDYFMIDGKRPGDQRFFSKYF